MLPLILTNLRSAGLAGRGDARDRRAALLGEAGFGPIPVADDATRFDGLAVLFIAGMEAPEALAARARARGILVNVEDVPELCDFHVPALVRRGDLLLTVSTGGKAPGLSRLIRTWLEARFGGEWAARIGEAEQLRRAARAQGASMMDVSARLKAYAAEKGWLS